MFPQLVQTVGYSRIGGGRQVTGVVIATDLRLMHACQHLSLAIWHSAPRFERALGLPDRHGRHRLVLTGRVVSAP